MGSNVYQYKSCSALNQTWIYLLLILQAFSLTSNAAVCITPPTTEAGFIWENGNQHLPSNAQGVLFQVTPFMPTIKHITPEIGDNLEPVFLYRDNPAALLASHFSVTEIETQKQLTPTIEKLVFKEHLFESKTGNNSINKYQKVDRDIFSCGDKLDHVIFGDGTLNSFPKCEAARKKVNQAIKAGLYIKGTDEVNKAIGLFRIGAKEGFKPNHTYTIKFLGMPGYWNLEKTKQSYRAPKSLTIKIDEKDFNLNSFKKLAFTTKQNPKNRHKKEVYYAYDTNQRQYQDAFYSLYPFDSKA